MDTQGVLFGNDVHDGCPISMSVYWTVIIIVQLVPPPTSRVEYLICSFCGTVRGVVAKGDQLIDMMVVHRFVPPSD